MKTIIAKPVALFFFFASALIAAKPAGDAVQVKFKSQSANVQVAGTSSLHDWTEKSDKGQRRCYVCHSDIFYKQVAPPELKSTTLIEHLTSNVVYLRFVLP